MYSSWDVRNWIIVRWIGLRDRHDRTSEGALLLMYAERRVDWFLMVVYPCRLVGFKGSERVLQNP
jgi:hypothetical protein